MNEPGLGITAALAGARAYGWSVTRRSDGFTAQCGSRILTAVFTPGGGLIHASVRRGSTGQRQSLRASEVIGTLAQYGQHGLIPADPTEER